MSCLNLSVYKSSKIEKAPFLIFDKNCFFNIIKISENISSYSFSIKFIIFFFISTRLLISFLYLEYFSSFNFNKTVEKEVILLK